MTFFNNFIILYHISINIILYYISINIILYFIYITLHYIILYYIWPGRVLLGEVRFDFARLVFHALLDVAGMAEWLTRFVSSTQNPKH